MDSTRKWPGALIANDALLYLVGFFMKTSLFTISVICFAVLAACNNAGTSNQVISQMENVLVHTREPVDSANYKHIKYNFYLSKAGQLCERKLASAWDAACHCLFQVYYDSTFTFFNEDTTFKVPLSAIIDLPSLVRIDSTEYTKDKTRVYYFHHNSDGGNRLIVEKADPLTFSRLCEYRWGADKNHVYYQGQIVQGVNLKKVEVLFNPDTANPFVDYIKDDRKVYYGTEIVEGAHASTFKMVSGQEWEAEDKNYKYKIGRRMQ